MFRGWGKKVEKRGSSDADMFRRLDQQDSVSLRFPVAMRPSNASQSWNTIIAEEVEEDQKKTDDHTFLQHTSAYEWNNLLFTVLQLPYNVYWQIALISTIVGNMVILTTLYAFLVKLGLADGCLGVFLITIVVSDAVYICDVVIALLHMYWKSIRLLIKVQRRSRVALAVDLITILPLTYISFLSGKYRDVHIEFWIRAITFLRIYRVQVLFEEWANSAARSHWKMFAVRYIVFFFLLSHVITCFWFFKGCVTDCEDDNSWISFSNVGRDDDKTWSDWYLTSMYFALTTVCNVGLGDISAFTNREHIIAIFGMMLGFCLTTGFYIGSITSQMVNSARRRSVFTDRLRSIQQNLDIMQINSRMKAQILRYYETLWVIKRGIKTAADFELLPKPLQMEVAYDINVVHFERSPLFRDLNEPFLRKLSLHMHNEFHLPGTIIFHQNVAKNMMICVASGVIEILSDEDNESPMISFSTGTILGEVSLLMTVPAKATVRAATYTELQVLHKVDFYRMMIDYPQIYSQINYNIMSRLERAVRRETDSNKKEVSMSLFVSRQTNRTAIWILKDKLRARAKQGKAVKTSSDDDLDFDSTLLNMYRLSKNIGEKKHVWMCVSAKFPFVLEPDTILVNCWDYFIFGVTLLVAFFFPFYIGYQREFPTWVETTAFLITVLYAFDFYIVCSTAIHSGTVVINTFMQIVYKRMESLPFYLDLCACLPLEVVALFLGDTSSRLTCVLFLNRLLKVWRIPALFSKLEENLWANLLVIRVVKYITLLLIISHWAGVLLFMVSCYNVQCTRDSWFHQTMLKEVRENTEASCYTSPNMMSMYFGLNLLSGVGYGDIFPASNMEAIAVCVVMVMGVLIFGWGIAEFSSTFTALGRQRVEYQEVLFAIQRFMSENFILPSIYQRVVTYFQLQWNYNRGTKVLSDKSIIDDATLEMKQELLSKERMDTLLDVPLFSMTDMDYVQLVATGSKISILPPDEVITYAGAISREMYIVQEGYCVIDGGSVNKSDMMGPNSHFGDIEMLFGIPMAVTVRTITHCKVISIEYSVYMQAISLFPFIMREMQELTNSFSEEIKQIGLQRKALHFERIHNTKMTLKQKMKTSGVKWSKEVRNSFLNVKKQCKASGESYKKPFAVLQKMRWLRYLLLPFCILPGSRFLKGWAFLRIIAALAVGVIGPLQLGISPYGLHLAEVINMLDVFAYVDVYLMLHVGYYNKQGLLITHPYKTARYYLTTSFVLDLIACFPFEFILLLVPDHTEGHTAIDHQWIIHPQHCIARLNRVLQLHRLPGAIAYLESDIGRKTNILRVIKFLPFTFVFINVCAGILTSAICRFRYNTDSEERVGAPHITRHGDLEQALARQLNDALDRYENEETAKQQPPLHVSERNASVWVQGNGTLKYLRDGGKKNVHDHPDHITFTEGHMDCKSGSWLLVSHFSKMQLPYGVYIIAYYWVTTTVTSVGFGDITASSPFEMYIVIFMIVVGVLMFGYMFASIASSKASQNLDSLYQEMLSELVSFLEQEGVDKDLTKRMVNHFEYKWRRTSGVHSHVVFSKLHTALMEDAVLWMYEATLREVPLFEKVEPSFFRVIGRHMRQSYFMRGETIIRSQDVQSNIYIIYRGKVEVMSSYNEMVACMGPGGLFGNIASISASICSVTIVASRNVDALLIPSDLFYQTLKNYPSVLKNMEIVLMNAKDYIMPTTIIHTASSISVAVEGEDGEEGEGEKRQSVARSVGSIGRKMSVVSKRSTQTTSTNHSNVTGSSMGTVGEVGTVAYLILPWKWFSFGMLPQSNVYMFMTVLVTGLAYLDCLIISYSFAFQERESFVFFVTLGLESIFYIKVLVDLHEAYMDKFGDYICDNKRIRERYFSDRKRVIWDVVPNLPVEVLVFACPRGVWMLVLSCVRLIHLLRFKYIIDYFIRRSSLINVNKIMDEVMKIFIVVTIVAHISACIWYLLSCPLNVCIPYTWGFYNLVAGSYELEAYLKSLYFIFTVFTTTGFGDVIPHGLIEVSFIIFIMLLSKFFVALFLGDVTSLVTSTTSTLVNYEYGVNELRDSLLNQYVSDHQQEKVWNYVQQLWKHGRGKQMPRFIEQAPYVLQSDVMNAMYGHHLRNSYIFTKLNDDFLRQLTVRLHHFVYFEENYIVQHGDTDHNMYFIHRGEVDVLTVHSNLTETIHDVLKPGDVFGVAQGLFHGLPHRFSFRAKTIVDIVTLNLDTWYGMLEYFPDTKATIYERAANIYSQV